MQQTTQPPTLSKQQGDDPTGAIILGGMVALVLAAPLALALAGLLAVIFKGHRYRYVIYGVLAAAGAGLVYLWWPQVQAQAAELAAQVGPTVQGKREALELLPLAAGIWFKTWPLGPALLLAFVLMRPRSAAEELEAKARQQEQADQLRSKSAQAQAAKAPDEAGGSLVLGRRVDGDLTWNKGPWATYPADVLARHAVLIGASGSGKTETALRLAALAAKVYGWQVVYLDFKGDEGTAVRFMAAMSQAGAQRRLMFPALSYDGWRGEPLALVNRLMAVVDYSEPYYRDGCKRLLTLVCTAPDGPPESAADLLERLNKDALTAMYANQPRQLAEVKNLDPKVISGVHLRYAAFFGILGDKLNGDYAFEDADAAYMLVDGTSLKEEAASLGRYLLEDFTHYCARRKEAGRKLLCIIDEFSAISEGGADAANLLERLRSFGAAVVISSQSYMGLGENADRMLDAAAAVLLHQSADPETIAGRAGARKQAEIGYQLEEGKATGMATMRMQDSYRVPPDKVRQLPIGQCYVIGGGRAGRVAVARLSVPAEELTWAGRYLSDAPGTVRQADSGAVVIRPVGRKERAAREREATRRAYVLSRASGPRSGETAAGQAVPAAPAATVLPAPQEPAQKAKEEPEGHPPYMLADQPEAPKEEAEERTTKPTNPPSIFEEF